MRSPWSTLIVLPFLVLSVRRGTKSQGCQCRIENVIEAGGPWRGGAAPAELRPPWGFDLSTTHGIAPGQSCRQSTQAGGGPFQEQPPAGELQLASPRVSVAEGDEQASKQAGRQDGGLAGQRLPAAAAAVRGQLLAGAGVAQLPQGQRRHARRGSQCRRGERPAGRGGLAGE